MPFYVRNDLRSRVRQAVERRLRQVPYVEGLLHLGHRRARANHVARLPRLHPTLQAIHRQLDATGVVQFPLTDLGLPIDDTVRAADAHVETLRRRAGPLGTDEVVSDEDLLSSAEPFLFGLSPALLDLAECYLGLPVAYLGVNVKREVANGLHKGARLWHADPEDERVLKLIVYLNDVDGDSGPFEALDARFSEEARKELRYAWASTCTPEVLARVASPSQWRSYTGPRLTAILCDTARCLHRASPPTARDRYSMTFSYLSRKAHFCFASGRVLQETFIQRWSGLLDTRQLSAATPP